MNDSHWVKCGIEFCDGSPRLSVVVCNVFSDWSTQLWNSNSARLRIHKVNQWSSLVVEAAPIGSDNFQFVRVAHLSSLSTHLGGVEDLTPQEMSGCDGGGEAGWRVGPFAACPIAQKGCHATFSQFTIGPKIDGCHSSEW